jgi:hypothetical protein
MNEDDYCTAAQARYNEVLASATHEQDLQVAFEEHPPLLPEAFPHFAGHGAYLGALVSQPDLQGLGERTPDFVWLARDSGTFSPVFVEIERPTKKWVTESKDPRPTSDLTQALNQFRQWREWLNRPQNRLVFFAQYGIPESWQKRRFSPRYLLIYGRRDENPEEIARVRADLEREDMRLITYDHIRPQRRQLDYISAKCRSEGVLQALHMPASARLTPDDPDEWKKIVGREDMVERNTWISGERRQYLVEERIPQWQDWAEHYRERQDLFRREMGKLAKAHIEERGP